MALTLGVLALVEAKPGKEAEVEAFGFRVDDSTFGIFDAFEDEAARQAHLSGQIPAALASAGPQLLAKDPDIRLVDVLAVKGA
jgi:hypothetical protein